jgi:hypothetical protein
MKNEKAYLKKMMFDDLEEEESQQRKTSKTKMGSKPKPISKKPQRKDKWDSLT